MCRFTKTETLSLQQSRPTLVHSNTPTLPCRATGRWCSLRCTAEHRRGHDFCTGCAPSHLKKDEEVVLAGVRRDPEGAPESADTSLRTNRDFVLQCVKLQGRALVYADPSVRSDREVQLAAVAHVVVFVTVVHPAGARRLAGYEAIASHTA